MPTSGIGGFVNPAGNPSGGVYFVFQEYWLIYYTWHNWTTHKDHDDNKVIDISPTEWLLNRLDDSYTLKWATKISKDEYDKLEAKL
jgi:hypothetical protein